MEAVGLSETPLPLHTARSHILVNCDQIMLCYNTLSEWTAVLCNTEITIGHVFSRQQYSNNFLYLFHWFTCI